MNRLLGLAFEDGVRATSTNHTETALSLPRCDFRDDGAARGGDEYALFGPLHYEPNYAYPLLVWLHGGGDDERQLQRIIPSVSLRNFVAVAPRGITECGAGLGYDWPADGAAIHAADEAVAQSVARAAARYHIAQEKVFLGGYLSGGTMALRLALLRPGNFAGVFSVGGPFPVGDAPLAQIERVRLLPILIAQGRQAIEYPTEQTCRELRLFHAAGLCVSLRQYPCGDELTSQMLHDVNAWIMEQVTGTAS